MTQAERQAALEQIADEVRVCTRCRPHQQRTRSVPGEGNPDTEVVFVGEGPGFNEDREGRPFVGRAGGLLVKLLASVGWRREDVFITNVVKCRPPDNRDPQPDEIAACSPFLRRQLEALDPALVVTLGRYSMGTFMPGARIGQAHGTMTAVEPATGAGGALAFAMYHPAAALRSTEVEATSFRDMAGVPQALLKAREQRERRSSQAAEVSETEASSEPDAGPGAIAPQEAAQSLPDRETTSPDLTSAAVAAVTPEPAAPDAGAADPTPGDKSLAKGTYDPSADRTEPVPPVLVGTSLSPTNPTSPASSTAALPPAALEPDPSTDQLTLF